MMHVKINIAKIFLEIELVKTEENSLTPEKDKPSSEMNLYRINFELNSLIVAKAKCLTFCSRQRFLTFHPSFVAT